ncbi:MAG: TolC family outer membrane protein [Pseudomonadota bacterium]
MKLLTRSLRLALLAGASVVIISGTAGAMTLQEAAQLAVSTNPDIGVASSNREAVDQELRQARGLYLPQIDFEAGAGPEWLNDSSTRLNGGGTENLFRSETRITLQQRLFDGYEAGSTVDREKARVESAANRVKENSEILALDAIGAFLEVLRGRELVRLAEENLAVHLDILASLQKRLSGGGGSRADVTQTETRAARARATLTENYNVLRDAEAEFTRIVGQFPDDLEQPVPVSEALPPDLETAVEIAGSNNLTTKIFEADVRSAEAEVEISEVPLYPSVSLEAESEYIDGATGFDTYQFNNAILLRLRWNLFRGGIDRAARQEALARVTESKNRRYQSHLDAEREMRQSWFALEASRQSVIDLESAVQFSRETRDAYVKQFEVAQRTLLDVLDAENELFVSQSELVTAQTNESLATYRILAVEGILMQTIGVTAPAQAQVQHKTWSEGLLD